MFAVWIAFEVRTIVRDVAAVLHRAPELLFLRLVVDSDRPRRARHEIEIAHQRRVLPRDLPAGGVLAHACAHTLEHFFNLERRLLHVRKQVLRVDAMLAAGAVARFGARRGGERDQRSDRGVQRRKATGRGARCRHERVVAAGIEDDDVDRVLRDLHLLEHLGDVDRMMDHLVFALDARVDRQQVVAALHLHTVSGVIEQPDTAGLDAITEYPDRLEHLVARGVFELCDVEAERAQGRAHGSCIVDRVVETLGLVRGVTDHQRVARPVVLGERGRRARYRDQG